MTHAHYVPDPLNLGVRVCYVGAPVPSYMPRLEEQGIIVEPRRTEGCPPDWVIVEWDQAGRIAHPTSDLVRADAT